MFCCSIWYFVTALSYYPHSFLVNVVLTIDDLWYIVLTQWVRLQAATIASNFRYLYSVTTVGKLVTVISLKMPSICCPVEWELGHKMELVNFSREDLGTVVTSSCVFDDNHPPSNLISTKQSHRSAGYRAEHFIRPPVKLMLQFAIPINIQSVCIQLNQLSVHSTTAELCLPRADRPVKICSELILKGNTVIRLINRGLSLDDLIMQQTALGSFLQLEKVEGKINNPLILNGVNSLELKIVRSSSYHAPAVKAFEVWGLFDTTRNNAELQKYVNVIKSWKQQSQGKVDFLIPSVFSAEAAENHTTHKAAYHSSTTELSQTTNSPGSNSGQSSSGQVPERYLDEVTYELMLVPMLLPSGHYVDQTTIDKFSSVENSWGRPSADPFTGIAFTSTAKPKFCPHLKVQIDEFLTKNNQQYPSVGRTVGNADQLEKHLLSRKRPNTNIYSSGDETQPQRKRPG